MHQQLLARHGQGRIAVTMLAPAIWEIQTRTGAQSLRGGDCRRHRSTCKPAESKPRA
jgi:hypothetical protein